MLLELNRISQEIGILDSWIATLRGAFRKLQTSPEQAGDPLFRLKHLNLTCHRLLLDRVCFHYAIHDWERVVFLQSETFVLDHPMMGG